MLSSHVIMQKPFGKATKEYVEINLPTLHLVTLAKDLLDPLFVDQRTGAIAISVMWAIWSSRNKYTHDEIKYQPIKSMQIVDELLSSLEIPVQEQGKGSDRAERWKSSDTGWIKINSDGVQGYAGAFLVAHDHFGSFIRARSNK